MYVVCRHPIGRVMTATKAEPVDKMAVDLGLTKEEAEQKVSLGDRIIINGEPRTLMNHRVSSAALDDRAGCAALIRCAQLLYDKPLKCGLTILFSTREETGSQGKNRSIPVIFPTEAIAADVSRPPTSREWQPINAER